MKRGENLQIDFLAKSSPEIFNVKSLKLNGHKICPNIDEENVENADNACVKFEMIDEAIPGRWDGLLTVHPKLSTNNVLQVAIEVDSSAWALGVSNDDDD